MLLAPDAPDFFSHIEAASLQDIEQSFYPAVQVETLTRVNAKQAYDSLEAPTDVRPDRTMRSLALYLKEPRGAEAGPVPINAELTGLMCCPLTLDTYDNPVIAADGFTYSLNAIKQHWMSKAEEKKEITSPMRHPLGDDFRLIPNDAMRAWMARAGLIDHSPEPILDDVAQFIAAQKSLYVELQPEIEVPAPVRVHLKLDYTSNAAVELAQFDRQMTTLEHALKNNHRSIVDLVRIELLGLKGKKRLKRLFEAPEFSHLNTTPKLFRAADVALQLGHVKKALQFVRAGLELSPGNHILLSRMAVIRASQGLLTAATEIMSRLLGCSDDEVLERLQMHTTQSASPVHRSAWPLLAVHGLLLLEQAGGLFEGRALLAASAERFPSLLLRRYC